MNLHVPQVRFAKEGYDQPIGGEGVMEYKWDIKWGFGNGEALVDAYGVDMVVSNGVRAIWANDSETRLMNECLDDVGWKRQWGDGSRCPPSPNNLRPSDVSASIASCRGLLFDQMVMPYGMWSSFLNQKKKLIHLILTGIKDEIYSTIDACQTAQEMWEAIERLQQGESLNIQDVKTNLFWEFGQFTSHDGETIESYYTRFYEMMNEMIRNNFIVAMMQVNAQFLQQL
ncbi:hypothetical protein Tco_0648066 [Tanacetum coccineum]